MRDILLPPLGAKRRFTITVAVVTGLLLAPGHLVQAQDRSGGFLDNLFNRGEQPQAGQQQPGQVAQGQAASADPSDPSVRLDRIENALRQLTGTVEQLQYRNQQLEMQLKRLQDDTDYRLQQSGPKAAPAARPAGQTGRRSDVFDPAQHPDAPGVPGALGGGVAAAPNDQPVGVPDGRAAGAPLDLSTLAGNASQVPAASAPAAPLSTNQPVTASQVPVVQNNNAPMPAARNAVPNAANTRLATLPPSARPQDEYDLAYGYVLHKDYALAEQAFRDFLHKYPDERLVPDAQYWLGESLYQRQRYRDAAESFLAVSTKYEHAGKAPNALLRLGQSLAALHQKEAACATLAEVGRKYPKASSSVKRGVAQEIKRAHC